MGAETGINWTDSTWNPLAADEGRWHCTKVSPGCENCYAERFNMRLGGPPFKHGADRIRLKGMDEKSLLDPVRWRRPRKIFGCSMTDLFHEQVRPGTLDAIFGIMAACQWKGNAKGDTFPGHIFQILTKRAERQREYLSGDHRKAWAEAAVHYAGGKDPDALYDMIRQGPTVLPHLWVGVTVEDQQRADERIPVLLDTPAAVRWVSAEPLLGPIDFYGAGSRGAEDGDPCAFSALSGLDVVDPPIPGIDWVVVGGESGGKKVRRDMDPAWAESIMEQCKAAGTAFWMKQMGGSRPGGPIPDHLNVRQFPGTRKAAA